MLYSKSSYTRAHAHAASPPPCICSTASSPTCPLSARIFSGLDCPWHITLFYSPTVKLVFFLFSPQIFLAKFKGLRKKKKGMRLLNLTLVLNSWKYSLQFNILSKKEERGTLVFFVFKTNKWTNRALLLAGT